MLALLSAIMMLPAQPASLDQARNGHEPITVTIRHDDLDLATDAGVRQLRRRLIRGAATACPLENSRDLSLRMRVMECRRQAQIQGTRQFERILAQRAARPSPLG